MKFQYYLPVNLIFGRGRVAELGGIASGFGKKALVVTGGNSTKKSGLLDRVCGYIKDSGIEAVVFDKVTPNPLTTTAEEGALLAAAEHCEMVVGVGGGSIMDCAKAIAFLVRNPGDINDYIFNRKTGGEALPLILIPTTCGTGSEGNGFAVLTNPDNGDKKSLRCNAIVAKASIVDSELMETMPKQILASVGFDAFCHCIEAYVSRISQPLTDMMALYAMNLIGKSLLPLYRGEGNEEDWDALSLASTLGGMVINTAGVTVAHGMEHPASGLKDIVHGNGLAALTPVTVKYSIKGCPEKFADISKSIGGQGASDCVEQIEKLLSSLNLKIGLSELGITAEDVPWMTENCFRVSSAGIANHPVQFSKEDINKMYHESL